MDSIAEPAVSPRQVYFRYSAVRLRMKRLALAFLLVLLWLSLGIASVVTGASFGGHTAYRRFTA